MRSTAELGERIASRRQDNNLTQADLAEWLAVDRTTVVRLEQGKATQLDRLFDVIAILGLDLVVVPRNSRVVVEPPVDPRPT